MSQTSLKQKVGLHIDIIMPWDYSTIYWNFSVAFFVHTAHGCQIQMCHQNYSKLSGTFYTGETLILYRTNIRFLVPPGGNLNFSLMTVYKIHFYPCRLVGQLVDRCLKTFMNRCPESPFRGDDSSQISARLQEYTLKIF